MLSTFIEAPCSWTQISTIFSRSQLCQISPLPRPRFCNPKAFLRNLAKQWDIHHPAPAVRQQHQDNNTGNTVAEFHRIAIVYLLHLLGIMQFGWIWSFFSNFKCQNPRLWKVKVAAWGPIPNPSIDCEIHGSNAKMRLCGTKNLKQKKGPTPIHPRHILLHGELRHRELSPQWPHLQDMRWPTVHTPTSAQKAAWFVQRKDHERSVLDIRIYQARLG